jgi:hypothetical protein
LLLRERHGGAIRLNVPLDVHEGRKVLDCKIAPNRRIAILLFSDGTAEFRDLISGQRLADTPRLAADPTSAAFHPDGESVVVGYSDGTALVWNLERLGIRAPRGAHGDLPECWQALASADGHRAHRAAWTLQDGGEPALALLAARVKPAVELSESRARQLIVDLDSPQFGVRSAAEAALLSKDNQAIPHLKLALGADPSLEKRRRIERMLADIPTTCPSETLRTLRAIEVLEFVGGSLAKRVLQQLAAGAPNARTTIEAASALKRLQN